MDAISNHAREAAQREQERRYSESDLEDEVGATIGNAYLVEYDGEDVIMVVTGIEHKTDPMSNGLWRCPADTSEDEFARGILINAEFYCIRSIRTGAYITHDDPIKTPTFHREALHSLRRRPLETGVADNAYAHPSSL